MDAVRDRLRGEGPPLSRRGKAVAAGALLVALAAIGVALGGRSGDAVDGAATSGAADAASAATTTAAAATSEAAAAATASAEPVVAAAAETAAAETAAAAEPAPAPAGGRDLSVRPRIAQNGSITVRVAPGELDASIDRLNALADTFGGYVAGTEANLTGAAGKGQATVDLRVPTDRYARAVQRVADLGTVLARQSSSEDLTQDYVDTGSRLRHARLVEQRLVALLDRARTINETLAIQARLDDVQLRIETDKGRIDHLARITDYAMLSVRLMTGNVAPAAVSAAPPAARPWGLRSALDDAAHNVADTVAAMTRGLGVVLPLLVLALVAWGAYRLLRRRVSGRRPPAEPA